MKFCKYCGEQIPKESIVCPKCGRQLQVVKENKEIKAEVKENSQISEKKKFYAEIWFMWVMLIVFAPVGIFFMWKFHPEMKKKTKVILTIVFAFIFLIFIFVNNSDNNSSDTGTNTGTSTGTENKPATPKAEVTVIDFSTMTEDSINSWCTEKKVKCNITSDYSDTIPKGGFVSQSATINAVIHEGDKITIIYSLGKKPTTGETNALKKAETYSSVMHMSKKRIYKQLTSEYGEGFTAAEAQYAIDNIKADWNANALATAKNYQETMSMSKSAIYKQLISEYGEEFTKDEAQYAIDHLDD